VEKLEVAEQRSGVLHLTLTTVHCAQYIVGWGTQVADASCDEEQMDSTQRQMRPATMTYCMYR